MNNAPIPSRIVRQRGAFAFLAILLLLVVVAVAIRMLLGSSQTTTYDTAAAGQSVQAYLLGASAQERAVALLKSAIPNSMGNLDAIQCTSIGSGSYDLGNPSVGSVQFSALTPTPAGCDTVAPNTCTGCDVQVTGTVASASRVLNLSVSYSSSPGVTGFGTNITERLKATVAPSAAVFNLAYRRQMSTFGGGQATLTVTTCNGCNEQWDLQSSSGGPSVGGEGVYASLPTPGTYTLTQTLSDARNYVEVGLLLSGAGLGPVGSYATDQGGTGKTTTGTSNTVTGETSNGAVNATDWCRGGDPKIEPGATGTAPFADTLIFGFSGRSDTTADKLNRVTFNCEEFGNAAKCKNPVRLDRQQRLASYAGDMYSEIWLATNLDYTTTAVGNFPIGATTITVSSTSGLDPRIKLGSDPRILQLVAVKSGTGEFQPGTIIDDFTTTTIVLNQGLKRAISNGAVICGGTCAFFDHTTNGNTSFNIDKTAGTTQWAAGFMCVKGSPSVVPIFQGVARPVVWYEPF